MRLPSRELLSYSGSYMSQRHSALEQVRPATSRSRAQVGIPGANRSRASRPRPLRRGRRDVLTESPSTGFALDRYRQLYWRYQHNPDAASRPVLRPRDRSLGIVGDKVFMATIVAKLIALDIKTGQPAAGADSRG